LLSLAACATDGPGGHGDPLLAGHAAPQASSAVRSYTPQPGLSGVMPAMANHRVVFVGESHDRYDHHLAQLMVIRALHVRHPQLAIGLEFFQQPYQAVLDDYVAGRIDEAQMLRRSEYFSRWGYDYRLYRPIMRYAREQGIPLLALNLPRELTGRIGEVGLEGLNTSEQAQLPENIDRANAGYRQRLLTVFKQHNGNTGHGFERFHEVQLAWDEGMAARAAGWLQAHPQGQLVVLAGSGHINADAAIPQRLQRRLPVDVATVVLSGAGGAGSSVVGNYYLLTEEQRLPAAGLLGVMLDNGQQPPLITGFSKTSDAPRQGAQKGDRIVAINGQPISDYTDLKLALLERSPGDQVELGLLRVSQPGEERRLLIKMVLQ
jgi:uncharacterized iron-regulated protein